MEKALGEPDRIPAAITTQLETDGRYAPYLRRQDEDIAALKKDEAIAIPAGFEYAALKGLSTEARQKLALHQPTTLAQAARLDGMTPAALLLLRAALRRGTAKEKVRGRGA